MEIRVNDKVYRTRFDIGEKVLAGDNFGKMDTGRFVTGEIDSTGNEVTELRAIVYTINDITMSLATGEVMYQLSYSDDKCLFRAGCRSARDREIIAAFTGNPEDLKVK